MAPETMVGIDIGATKISIAVCQNNGLRPISVHPTPPEPDGAVQVICHALEGTDEVESIGAIGIGCPGPLDHGTGVILTPPNLPQWHGYPLADTISSRTGVPVFIENDGNLGALGEASYGAGVNHDTVLYLAVGTGLGAGLVRNGEIDHGSSGCAAEIWAFEPSVFEGRSGPPVNDTASGKGLVMKANEAMSLGVPSSLQPGFTTHDVVEAYATDDAAAIEAFTCARHALTAVIIFSVMLVDPDVVVLGGGMCQNHSWFVDPVRLMFEQQMPIDRLKEKPITGSPLGGNAVLFGAVQLAQSQTVKR